MSAYLEKKKRDSIEVGTLDYFIQMCQENYKFYYFVRDERMSHCEDVKMQTCSCLEINFSRQCGLLFVYTVRYFKKPFSMLVVNVRSEASHQSGFSPIGSGSVSP